MFSNEDDNLGVVMGVIFGVIALVISLIIGVTIYTKNKAAKAMPAPAAVTAPAAADASPAAGTLTDAGGAAAKTDNATTTATPAATDGASVQVEGGVVKFFFASGKTELGQGGEQALADIIAGVKAGKKAIVSGYVDSTGNAAQNAEIGKKRAIAVGDLLKASGVAEDKMELKKPDDIKAGTGAQARRVEVTLQ